MQTGLSLRFGLYRFDPQLGQLWRGTQEVRLTGKAVAVLRYVMERAGQVVTKGEIFAAVWPDTVVSDAAPEAGSLRGLRRRICKRRRRCWKN